MTLRTAVKNGIVLRIKYYPNKDGQQRTGWRTVLPLDLYRYRGNEYVLCWFTDGSSVSGGTGYRLFFTKNIQDMEELPTDKQQPFAMQREILSKSRPNFKVMAWVMVKQNNIE